MYSEDLESTGFSEYRVPLLERIESKIVMERSWNVENWQKVMKFVISLVFFFKFCPQFLPNVCDFD